VYQPNEAVDPALEKNTTAFEFIREHRPANMNKEPALVLERTPAPSQAARSDDQGTSLSKSDLQFYNRLRKYPVALLKQFAYKNAPEEAGKEPEKPLVISQKGLRAQKQMLLKRKKDMLTKLNPSFETRLRLYERGVDVDFGAPVGPLSGGTVYREMKEMVEETEKAVLSKHGKKQQSFFDIE